VIHLFTLIPEHFDEAMCLKLIELYNIESIDIRNSIGELLDTMGQGHLINTD